MVRLPSEPGTRAHARDLQRARQQLVSRAFHGFATEHKLTKREREIAGHFVRGAITPAAADRWASFARSQGGSDDKIVATLGFVTGNANAE